MQSLPPDAPAAPPIELADLLFTAMRRLRRGMHEALAPLGLSGSDARVIRLLAAGPLRMAAIADRLAVVPRTATDMVDRVEAAGLVARRAAPDDRRSVLVELTPAGRRLVWRLEAARAEGAIHVFGGLSPAEQAALLSLLRTVCAADGCSGEAAPRATAELTTGAETTA